MKRSFQFVFSVSVIALGLSLWSSSVSAQDSSATNNKGLLETNVGESTELAPRDTAGDASGSQYNDERSESRNSKVDGTTGNKGWDSQDQNLHSKSNLSNQDPNASRDANDRWMKSSSSDVTSMDQSENDMDSTINQKIRQSIRADRALSVAGDNITITTANGQVTLRGLVRNESEKSTIESKVRMIANVKGINNEIQVDPSLDS